MTEVSESPCRLSEYVRSLPCDVRTRYLAKIAALNCDPYYVREVEFSTDATTWPPVLGRTRRRDQLPDIHAISVHKRPVKKV